MSNFEIKKNVEDVFCDMGQVVSVLSVISSIDCVEKDSSELITDVSITAGIAKEMVEDYIIRLSKIADKIS